MAQQWTDLMPLPLGYGRVRMSHFLPSKSAGTPDRERYTFRTSAAR